MSTTVAIPGKGLTDEELDALIGPMRKTPSRADPVSTPGKGLTDAELDALFTKVERPRPRHQMSALPTQKRTREDQGVFPG